LNTSDSILEKINTIGIIGAGTMGRGIASIAASSNFTTLIYDINDKALTKAHANIARGYDRLVEKEEIDHNRLKEIESHLNFTSEIKSLSSCDFIIEAAVENLDLKKLLYSQLDDIVNKKAVLASNTSSLSITAISSAVKNNKDRVIGMHFFNPANLMKLVEVIKGEFTSDSAVELALSLAKRLGKTPVLCKDSPGFLVNRIARSFYGEALKIIGEENLRFEVIDNIMREEGEFRMGPFELMDLIGIDINYEVTKSVFEAFYYDPKYKPHPIQQKMVEAGMLGKKTGRGFYSYNQ
jgi:3-hydroxybutyryl-CoA dehydrogenase